MDFATIVNGFLDATTWLFGIATLFFSYIVVWRTAWFANSTNQVPPWGRMAYQITVFFLIAFALNFAPAYLTQATTEGLKRSRVEQEALQTELNYWVQDARRDTPTPGALSPAEAPTMVVVDYPQNNGVTAEPTSDPNQGGGVLPTQTPFVLVVTATPQGEPAGLDNGEDSPPLPTATPYPTVAIPTLIPTIDINLWNVLTPPPTPLVATPTPRG